MKIEKAMSRWFQMSDEVWERHANPLSVWTRLPCLPALALSIWSRVWIGSWAWIPVVLTLLWIWLNPRVFPRPRTTDNWASQSVLGERMWLNRDQAPIDIRHSAIISVSNSIAATGAILCTYGLVTLDAYHTTYGVVLTLVGKSWFLDRMVWLYLDARKNYGRNVS